MAKARRALTAGLVGVMALAGSTLAGAHTLHVTLRVRNDAKIPADLLAAAESEVTTIYASAGVDATFVDGAADVMIVLLSRHTDAAMRQASDAVGFAPCTESARGHIAYIFQTRVDNIAAGYSAARSVVLGAAIAHEVGHLLLPLNAHSTTGIMRAEWNQVDFQRALQGQLLFTREQIAQIRSRMTEKMTGN
jgi:hypothetical protein